MVTSYAVTAGVTAVAVPAGQSQVLLRNRQSNTQIVWVGGSDVTPSNGFPLYVGEAQSFFGPGLFVCTSAGTADVRVLVAS